MQLITFTCNMPSCLIKLLSHFCQQVCPSDGRVLHFDQARNGLVEQVKGISYSLQDLIGPIGFSHRAKPDKPIGKYTTSNSKFTISENITMAI